jgi:hypothetical protein
MKEKFVQLISKSQMNSESLKIDNSDETNDEKFTLLSEEINKMKTLIRNAFNRR